MKNNKQILIIAFIALFFITTGSTFALCDVDPTIKTIRWFGDTTLEILKYSGYISLSYAFANGCYNYHYYIPKIGQSIFLIKWGDKLNGWLGFSSKGVLEQELELAKLTYSPLYKDFLEGVNNNFVAPFLGYLHIRPLTIERRVPFFVDRTRVEYRDRIEERIVYRDRDNENILSVRDSLDQLRSVANQNNILSNGLQQNFSDLQTEIEGLELLSRLNNLHITEIQDICRLDTEWLPNNHQILRIVEDDDFMLTTGQPTPGLRVYYKSKSIFSKAQAEHSLLISGFWFHNKYPKLTALIDGYSSNEVAVANQLKISYNNTIINPNNCSFIHKDTNVEYNIIDYLRNRALSTLNNPQNNIDLLIARVDQSVENLTLRPSYQNSPSSNRSENSVEGFLEEETQSQEPSDSVFGLSSTNMSAATTMGTLGIIGAISVLPINDVLTIFAHFLNLAPLEPLLSNQEAVRCLINIYANTTGSVPGLLIDSVSVPNPQDYLLPGESLIEPSSPSNVSNMPNPGTPYSYYIGTGLVILGTMGITWYLTKYGMDASPAVETAKTFKDSLHDKYVNFK